MKLSRVQIENFRLLRNVTISLEDRTTLIVGRNNTGKTSFAELFRRLLSEKAATFRLEDFSLGCQEQFWEAFTAFRASPDSPDAVALLPSLRITIDVDYTTHSVNSADLSLLSECIVDLDAACAHARLVVTFGPRANAPTALFRDVLRDSEQDIPRDRFYRRLNARLSVAYGIVLEAIDPGDPENRKELDLKVLTRLLRGGFINAQRGLDDDTNRERDVLGKVIEALFRAASTEHDPSAHRTTVDTLTAAVEGIQDTVHAAFTGHLQSLLPTFSIFGYPGLADPGITIDTTFDVEKLLRDHTRMRYAVAADFTLPETYNGLGARNLIFILLQLYRAFREYQTTPTEPGIHLVFIEEPEAHLHPQMQEVFIRKLDEITRAFSDKFNDGRPWPVQFIVTTHSSHIANEAHFKSIRYFSPSTDDHGLRHSVVRDLGECPDVNHHFLHQYLTLTRCDLFFADKAILVEGTSERLLLPKMIEHSASSLSHQFVTIMEVGGAYAHLFVPLLRFLNLPSLIITDLDPISTLNERRSTSVTDANATSNACLNAWFGAGTPPHVLLKKKDEDKVQNNIRIAYQVPETDNGPCGRSFEDAFILANRDLFDLRDASDLAEVAYKIAGTMKKSQFAIEHAIYKTTWSVPRYIKEGLRWLANTSR